MPPLAIAAALSSALIHASWNAALKGGRDRVADSFLGYVGARELAKDNTQLPELFVHITFARTVLAVLVFILLALIAAFINQPSHLKTMILIYGLVMFVLPWLIQWVFQGHDLMKYVGIASVTRWSVFTAASFLSGQETRSDQDCSCNRRRGINALQYFC